MVSEARQKEAERKHRIAMERFYNSNPNPICSICQKPMPTPTKAQRDQWWRRGTLICSAKCKEIAKKTGKRNAYEKRMETKYPDGVPCTVCGKAMMFDDMGKSQRAYFYKFGVVYCSKECSHSVIVDTLRNARAQLTHAEKIRIAKKTAETLVKNNFHINPLQRKVSEMLGWEMEYVVDIGDTYARIDIALPTEKIGIEIDDKAHARKERKEWDKIRDKRLRELGWKIYRFSDKTNATKIVSTVLA